MSDQPTILAFACSPEWIQANAPTDGDKPALPRFSMIGYSGAVMQLAGWRHPVVIDLAGLHIPSPRRPIRLRPNVRLRRSPSGCRILR